MLLFQSETSLNHWCQTNHQTRGEALLVGQVWELSRQWYGNRLSPEYHGRTLTKVEAIFRQVA
ncbi:MAG: alkylmercury lyase family protein [Anaerolineae bacterium]|nr:alkylmercury lyase family protein [Anaerolineae bacterium]